MNEQLVPESSSSQLGDRLHRERVDQILKREVASVQRLLADGWNLIPPKTAGTYEASFRGFPGVYRRWDGREWSLPTFSREGEIPVGTIQAKIAGAMFWRNLK